jgi:hypothetical protein
MADLAVMRKMLLSNNIIAVGDSEQPSPSTTSSKKIEEVEKTEQLVSSFNIVSFIISVFAVYLSWTCNTAAGMHVVMKVIYGFFAFIFGFIYLMYYLLVRSDICEPLLKK